MTIALPAVVVLTSLPTKSLSLEHQGPDVKMTLDVGGKELLITCLGDDYEFSDPKGGTSTTIDPYGDDVAPSGRVTRRRSAASARPGAPPAHSRHRRRRR